MSRVLLVVQKTDAIQFEESQPFFAVFPDAVDPSLNGISQETHASRVARACARSRIPWLAAVVVVARGWSVGEKRTHETSGRFQPLAVFPLLGYVV